ncbi:MAG: hypothetical protein WD576_00435 [Nitriliruptoraceae bacterium]
MSRRFTAEDKAVYRDKFMALEFADRRTIIRAVNRGQQVDQRRHAELAIVVAKRQIAFWRWAWLIGPLLGIAQLFFAPPEVALANGLFGGFVLATLAWWWIRRAQRAIEINHALAKGRPGLPTRSSRQAAPPDDHGSSTDDEHLPGRPAPRPPAPRGKKRRGRK